MPDADETEVLPAVGRTAEGGTAGDGPGADLAADFDRLWAAGRPAAGGARPAGGSSQAGETAVLPTVGDARTGGFRDPWEEPGASRAPGSVTHDPHEVTVQLDGIGPQLDNMLRPAKGGHGGGDGSDGPVFVDESGRRSRRFRRLGIVVGIACAIYAVVIVATLLSGNSNAPWLPVQDPKKDQPADTVDTSPLPAEPAAQPSGTGSASPRASASAGDGATPSPGASGSASSGASAGADDPGTSPDPRPSPTKTTPKPGAVGPTTDPGPTDGPTTSDPDPTTPTDDPTVEPTGSPTAADPGTGTVADGPSDPKPLAEEQGESTSSTSPHLSPEHTL